MTPKAPFRLTWGLSQSEWDDSRKRLRSLLRDVASDRSTITYSECAQVAFGGRFSPRSSALAQLLEEVCTLEDAERGVMLGSVVVRKDTGIPGKGYFTFAREDLERSGTTDRELWEQEVGRVWSAYRRQDG